jgi:AcrR family transcriptional regulator
LVEAAHELFMERDFDQVTTEEILACSGVSRGALYHHFPSKLDLFEAVYVASEQRALARIGASLSTASKPGEALAAAATAYLRLCESDEELRRIGLTQSRAVLGWERWRELAGELGIGVVRALVTAAIEAGELPRRDRGGDADRRRGGPGRGPRTLRSGDRGPARGYTSIASPRPCPRRSPSRTQSSSSMATR